MIDIVKIDVPTFIRLLELAREDVDNDMDLHDVAEKVVELSQDQVVTMSEYDEIVDFMKSQGNNSKNKYDSEMEAIRRLGGMSSSQHKQDNP